MIDVLEIILLTMTDLLEIILLITRLEIFPHTILVETGIILLMIIGLVGTLLHFIGQIGIMAISALLKIITEGTENIWTMVPRAAKDFIVAHVVKYVRWAAVLISQTPIHIDPLPA